MTAVTTISRCYNGVRMGGHEAVVRAILARDNKDPNYHNYNGTALFIATSSGHHAVAELLLARVNMDPNLGTVLGTPLEKAVLAMRRSHSSVLA